MDLKWNWRLPDFHACDDCLADPKNDPQFVILDAHADESVVNSGGPSADARDLTGRNPSAAQSP